MKWFRLYSDVLHDPKVQRLSPALFKHWINILCLANESDQRGLLPAEDDIAFALRIKPSDAHHIMEQLRAAGLIDSTPDGRELPHNWPQRQRSSDDIAARVREHRASKSGNDAIPKRGRNDDVTLHVTLHETPLKRSRAIDTDTDTEIPLGEDENRSNGVVRGDAPDDGDGATHTQSPRRRTPKAKPPAADPELSALCGQVARAAKLTASADALQHLIERHRDLGERELIFQAELAAEYVADPSRNKKKRRMGTQFLNNWYTISRQPPKAQTPPPQARASPPSPPPAVVPRMGPAPIQRMRPVETAKQPA